MLIDIPYGKEITKLSINDTNVAGIIECNDVVIGDERQEIFNSVNNPINSKGLVDFLKNAKNVLIVVNDGTRPTPTASILKVIYETVKSLSIKYIVATGAHRVPTEEEYKHIFGNFYSEFSAAIYAHRAKLENNMAYIGTTSNGTEVSVNKLAIEADRIIVIGSVEPHYFAGYTGGRKFLLPGIASYKTIIDNHKLALRERSDTFILNGNPVHEDMIEALRLFPHKNIFAIMTVLNKNHRIYAVTSGDIEGSFLEATVKAQEVFAVKIKEKSDIVISVAKSPTDINFYQSQKALDNGKIALKKNGIIILVSECRQGIGDESFMTCLCESHSPEEALQKIDEEYKFGYQKAARIASTRLLGDIYSVTSLPDSISSSLFMKPFESVQESVDYALSVKGPYAKVLVLLDGAMTVPIVSNK